mmetsp:Transcript_54982/g.141531  ORF Transcript_54982/g.141531 Transcript_54982/m.141531 type:complete len:173 (-) Transcript_54982:135-653(-)
MSTDPVTTSFWRLIRDCSCQPDQAAAMPVVDPAVDSPRLDLPHRDPKQKQNHHVTKAGTGTQRLGLPRCQSLLVRQGVASLHRALRIPAPAVVRVIEAELSGCPSPICSEASTPSSKASTRSSSTMSPRSSDCVFVIPDLSTPKRGAKTFSDMNREGARERPRPMGLADTTA